MPPVATKKGLSRIVVPFQLKAVAADDPNAPHTFEGLAATWQQDLGNDIIHRGAFKDTLAAWKSGPDAIPLLNSHDQYNVLSGIGQMTDAKETKEGLWTKWELLPGPEGDAYAARMTPSKVTKKPIVGKMSIGYEPVEYSFEQPEGTSSYWDRIRHLTKVTLKEVSLVLFPMNPGAAIDPSTVKSFLLSADATDPRNLDAATKAYLRKLASKIGVLLRKVEEPTDPSNPKGATIVVPATLVPASKTDLEDTEDDDEEIDPVIEDEDEVQDPPADPIEPSEEAEEEDETDGTKGTPAAPVTPEPKVYQFGEALTHRVKKLALQERLSAHNRHES